MRSLNLGCGDKKIPNHINLDISPACKPDMCWDVLLGLPYGDDTFDEVMAFDFLEHMPLGKQVYIIEEIWRVLKAGGIFEHLTPSTDGRGAFQDPTHQSFWNINSWLYYCSELTGKRYYNIKANFHVITLKDMFMGNDKTVVHTYGKMAKTELI